MSEEKRKPKCYNCEHAGMQFRVGKLTHLHCCKPEYEEMDKNENTPSPWETLRVFSDTCSDHQFKNSNLKEI